MSGYQRIGKKRNNCGSELLDFSPTRGILAPIPDTCRVGSVDGFHEDIVMDVVKKIVPVTVPGVSVNVCEYTPDLAKEILDTASVNFRKLNRDHAINLKEDILTGRW